MSAPFRVATRDELRMRGRVVESRLAHGAASLDVDGITASDSRDGELLALCDRELETLRVAAEGIDARVRLVADARFENDQLTTSATLTMAIEGMSVVSTPEHAHRDYELLRAIAGVSPVLPAFGYRGLPIVWRNGSASVLLHEAVGHAAEHEHPPLSLPAWISVDAPLRMRRATFRDVPLPRMTTLIATQTNAPFELSPRRIEVLLVAGGGYEPLTQTVTLHVAAADLVDDDETHRLPPFTIVESREAVARALAGAEGEPQRYPGVVCSREGQELVVGSHAPVILTWFR